MIFDVTFRALVCTTTRADVRRIDRSSLLQKRRRPVVLRLHITRMNKDRIVRLAFNKSMKPVLAHPGGIRTLPFQTENDCSARAGFALEKLCRLANFLAHY